MSSKYDVWMQKMLNEADDYVASPVELKAMLDYLNGETTADEAAPRYTGDAAKSENHATVYIWALIMDVAEEFPQAHEKLVELLKAIVRLPPLMHDGRTIKSLNQWEYWKDLPEFEFELRENHDGLADWSIRREPSKAPNFINLCAFIACANRHELIDWVHVPVLLCAEAFETDYDDQKANLDVKIPAAAQYFLLNGPRMYQHGMEDAYADLFAGPLLKKQREVSPTRRWDFWHERLSKLESDPALKEETRIVAKLVLDKMDEIAASAEN